MEAKKFVVDGIEITIPEWATHYIEIWGDTKKREFGGAFNNYLQPRDIKEMKLCISMRRSSIRTKFIWFIKLKK